MEEKEKLLSSPSVMPSLSGSEEDGKAECIKSVQSELVEGKDRLELLKTLEGMDVCTLEHCAVSCAWLVHVCVCVC